MHPIRLAFLLAAAVAAPIARAQTGGPFLCTADAGTPLLVRAEGLAERVSDIVLTCSGGQPGTAVAMNLTVTLGDMTNSFLSPSPPVHYTSLTSRVVAPASAGTEALLLIDDLAAAPLVGTNLFQGIQSGLDSVTFYQVPVVVPAAGATRTFRITNVRADARDLPGQTIQASLSVSGSASVPIWNPVRVVAVKAPGTLFSFQTTSNAPVSGLTFQQSGGVNPALVTSPQAVGGTVNYNLKFSEGFAQSFRKRNIATTGSNPAAVADQNTVGAVYTTESGYYNSALPSANGLNVAGLAMQGTRLVARFQNVPPGVALYVTVNPLPASGAPTAVLTASDPLGAGKFAPVAATTTASAGGTPVGIAPVSISNGSGIAAWEVLDADPSVLESATFGLVVAYQNTQNATATVSGGLGPLSTVTAGDAVSPVPRFADVSADSAGCSSLPCLTATPAATALSYQTGTSSPAPIAIQVGSTGAPLAFNAAVSMIPAGWLTLSATSGTTPAALTITIDPSKLAPAVYLGTVTLSSPTQSFAPVSVLVLLTVTVGPSGDRPLECSVTVPVPPLSRTEGLAELMGDIVFACSGGTSGAIVTTTIDLQTDPDGPEFTSRIVNSPASGTEATWMDEKGCFPLGPDTNPVQGILISPHLLRFPNVLIVAPGKVQPSPDCVSANRIVNVRFDARVLRNLLVGTARAQVNVAMSGVTLFGGDRVFPNPVQVAAFPQPGLAFSLATASDNALSAMVFQQPAGENVALASSAMAGGGTINFHVSFTEQFGEAFHKRNTGTSASAPTAVLPQNIPGTMYNTESGYFDPTLPVYDGLGVAGLATQGTRLMARFTNVPPGVRLYATVNPVSVTGPSYSVVSTAQLVSTDLGGAGEYSPVAATTTVNAGGSTIGIAPLNTAGGTATATWEVLEENPAVNEQFIFGVVASYTAPEAGSAAVNGSYAPLSSISNADSTSPVPRFGQLGNEKAAMLSPAPGSTFTGSSAAFTWTPGSNVDQYHLTAGISQGGSEYFDATSAGQSATITSLPADGRTVYIRLASLIQGAWQYSDYTYTAAGTAGGSPLLSLVKLHIADFAAGQNGAIFTIAVSNGASRGPTSGTVTVVDTLPAGMTLASISGAGWSCTGSSCSRADALPGGSAYPPITVKVNVASNAPSQVTNLAAVSGGGSEPSTARDLTHINLPGNCTYSIESYSDFYSGATATGFVSVSTSSGCSWTAFSSASWLTITAGSSGTGNGVVDYAVAYNPTSSSRSATLTIAGLIATITQPANTPPWAGSGGFQVGLNRPTFDVSFIDSDGWQDITVINVLINNILDGRRACYVAFVPSGPSAGSVFLVDDSGNAAGPYAGMTISGSGSIQNGQCTISGAGSSVTGSDDAVTLKLAVAFSSAFAGNKVMYIAARDSAGNNSGWTPASTWNVPGPPPVGPSPTVFDGTYCVGPTCTLLFDFTDPKGWQDLTVVNVLISGAIDGRNACYLAFAPSGPAGGSLYLVDDAGDSAGPYSGMVLPGTGVIQNSQCSVNGAGASVTTSGNTLSLTLPVSFTSTMSGNHIIYLAARSATQNSGWQAAGITLF